MNESKGRLGNPVSACTLFACLLALGAGSSQAQPGGGMPPLKQDMPAPRPNNRPEFDNFDQERVRARLAEDNAAATKQRLWTLLCIGSVFGLIVFVAVLIIGLIMVFRMSRSEPRPARSRRRREGVET